MFKKLMKRWNCTHEYHWIGSFRRWEGSQYYTFIVTYCPKCGHEKTQYEVDYQMSVRKNKVYQDYRRRNGECLTKSLKN